MIGSGAVSRHHFPAFRDRPDIFRLSAICEKNPSAASAFAAQFPYSTPIFAEFADLLDKAQVDAALVVLPHNLHFPIASKLVAERIPVLVEKPLTCSLEEARALKKLSRETGVPVVAGQMLRFANDVIWLKEWVSKDPGNFGALRTFDIQSWQNILAYVNRHGGIKALAARWESGRREGFQTVPKPSEQQNSDNPFTNQLVHFAQALTQGKPLQNTVFENFNPLACIDAI